MASVPYEKQIMAQSYPSHAGGNGGCEGGGRCGGLWVIVGQIATIWGIREDTARGMEQRRASKSNTTLHLQSIHS
jgi:hypothetical protein